MNDDVRPKFETYLDKKIAREKNNPSLILLSSKQNYVKTLLFFTPELPLLCLLCLRGILYYYFIMVIGNIRNECHLHKKRSHL